MISYKKKHKSLWMKACTMESSSHFLTEQEFAKLRFFLNKRKLQQFEPVKEELNKCLDLGFQTFALLIIMREQLTWNQIEERSAGLTRLQKNFLYLHCLDSLDHR